MPPRDRRSLPARHVRRLHLRAAADDEASRAATLLADALRTASLPGADDGRFVVIRRLDLGRIPAGAAAATLALRIERVTSEVLAHAVAYDDRSAGAAEAVTFRGRAAALVALARSHARGADTGEWFWPTVVPGWRTAGRTPRWLLLLDAVHTLPEALFVAGAVLEQVLLAGAGQELLAALSPGRGDAWLGPASGRAPVEDETIVAFRAASLEIIGRGRAAWGPSDDRLVWLAAAMAVREHPALVASPRLRSIVVDALKRLEPARIGPNQVPPDSHGWTRRSNPPRDDMIAGPAVPTHSGGAAPQHRDRDMRVDREGGDRSPRGSPTQYAGLFFVIPILQQLGFTEYVASRPYLLTIPFPFRLLSFIGQRVGMTEEDPVAASPGWADPGPMRAPAFVISDMPARLRAVLLSPAPRVALDSSYVAWLTAVRRWCRREVRIGLRALICRPGRVVTTRTHTDVFFGLSHVDLRVRRLALDADPGWVPWLGRTISFEYLPGDERSR